MHSTPGLYWGSIERTGSATDTPTHLYTLLSPICPRQSHVTRARKVRHPVDETPPDYCTEKVSVSLRKHPQKTVTK